MHKAQRLINHVALVLDASASMVEHQRNLIKVADEQIKHLALRSEEMSQETRVSVYIFNDRVQCVIFDMDVMRLPSIAELYDVSGMTALIDATLKSQEDLGTTSQIYGDHAFLTFVLTDGKENRSRNTTGAVRSLVATQPENWTIGYLVPDNQGASYVKRFLGADEGNVALWDTAAATGINDAVSTIRSATDNFMTARASGVRGSRSVFSTGAEAVNKQTVTTTLNALKQYNLLMVNKESVIRDFVQANGLHYTPGVGYYQLTKTETIQPQKKIAVLEKSTGKVYSGVGARGLIGLPEGQSIRVRPNHNPDYEVYVQSTSVNRKLLPGTKLLVIS